MPPDAGPRAALAEVRAVAGVHKPDPILTMDNMTRTRFPTSWPHT